MNIFKKILTSISATITALRVKVSPPVAVQFDYWDEKERLKNTVVMIAKGVRIGTELVYDKDDQSIIVGEQLVLISGGYEFESSQLPFPMPMQFITPEKAVIN